MSLPLSAHTHSLPGSDARTWQVRRAGSGSKFPAARTILSSLIACGALVAASTAITAADGRISRDSAVGASPAAKSDWEFAVGLPGWLPNLKGDIGIGGFEPVGVDLPFDTILSNLEMVAALGVEAQRGPWGFFAGGLYMRLGADGEPSGPLLDSVKVQLTMGLLEAGMTYRLWEGKRGYFDLLGGARYIYIGSTMNFYVDSNGAQTIGQNLAAEATGRVSIAVEKAVSDALPELKAQASDQIAAAAKSRIHSQVDRILEQYPNLPEVIDAIKGGSGPVNDALRELIAAKIAEKQATLSDATAAVNSKVAAAKAQAKAKLSRAAQKAERKLAQAVATAIEKAVPEEVSGSQSWVDPFVGFRARYNFTNSLYAVARADIGGFGVGSNLAWQAYGALGWQFNQHWSTELGYRYLFEDYDKDGFVFNASMAGAYIGVTYRF